MNHVRRSAVRRLPGLQLHRVTGPGVARHPPVPSAGAGPPLRGRGGVPRPRPAGRLPRPRSAARSTSWWSTTPRSPPWPPWPVGHGCTYVDPGRNLGFAGGVNLGCAGDGTAGTCCCSTPTPPSPRPAVRALHAALTRATPAGRRGPGPVGTPTAVDPTGWPGPSRRPAGAWLEAVGLGRLRRRPDFLIGSVLLLPRRGPGRRRAVRRPVLPLRRGDRLAAAGRRPRLAGGPRAPTVTATHVGAGHRWRPVDRETHFQASHERYVRKHHGTPGWWSYRAAAVVGAGVRAVVLPGDRGRAAATRHAPLPRPARCGPRRRSDRPGCGSCTSW